MQLHLKFNEICLKENLLPYYINFHTYDATAISEGFVTDCCRQLIERHVQQQVNEIGGQWITKEKHGKKKNLKICATTK